MGITRGSLVGATRRGPEIVPSGPDMVGGYAARLHDLPLYLDDSSESPCRLRHEPVDLTAEWADALAAVRRAWRRRGTPRRELSSLESPTTSPGNPSPVFHRMLDGDTRLLESALDAWWRARGRQGTARIGRWLRLGPPAGDPARGWTINGSLRRGTGVKWVPVCLELWPVHDRFTRVTLTPRGWVHPSPLYFRRGHALIERFWKELGPQAPRY